MIADTVEGRGVSFMERTALESDAALHYRFHSRRSGHLVVHSRRSKADQPSSGKHCERLGVRGLDSEQVVRPELPAQASTPERLIPAYSKALTEQVKRDPRLFVLDADLALDTGVLEARSAALLERFIECGIAEMETW